MADVSTKPYLIRALYEWCTDSGFTPYIAVAVDESVRVPVEFVRNGEIVLNVSALATSRLKLDNDAIHFTARFGGVPRDVYVPITRVVAIYARENGQGMAFDVPKLLAHSPVAAADAAPPRPVQGPADKASLVSVVAPPAPEQSGGDGSRGPQTPGDRPRLRRVK
jgi:stringent starvation protein B